MPLTTRPLGRARTLLRGARVCTASIVETSAIGTSHHDFVAADLLLAVDGDHDGGCPIRLGAPSAIASRICLRVQARSARAPSDSALAA